MNSWTPARAAPHLYGPDVTGSSPYALRPAWALIGVVVGTIAAVILVPASGYYLPGALVPAGLALSAGLLLGPVLSGLRNPLTAFRAEHLLMLGLVYWILLDALQGTYRLGDVSYDAVLRAFLATGFLAAFIWLGSCVASVAFPSAKPRGAAPQELGRHFLVLAGLASFVLGVSGAVLLCNLSLVCIADSLFAPRFASPWFSGPGIEGWNTTLAHLRYFGFLVLPITAALVHTERGLSWRSVLLGVLGLLFLLLLIRDGSRRSVGTVIGATILVWLLLRGSLRKRDYVTLLLLGLGLLSLMQAMLSWRNVGLGTAIVQGLVVTREDGPTITVDRNLEWMANAMQIVPERHPHTGRVGIAYILGHPVPRSVWHGKPVSRGIDLPKYMGRSYAPGFSWTCSAVGDLYLIGGFLALGLGGVLYGAAGNLLSRVLSRPMTTRAGLLYGLGAMTLFVSLRAVHEVMTTGLMILAAWGLLTARAILSRRLSAPARAHGV